MPYCPVEGQRGKTSDAAGRRCRSRSLSTRHALHRHTSATSPRFIELPLPSASGGRPPWSGSPAMSDPVGLAGWGYAGHALRPGRPSLLSRWRLRCGQRTPIGPQPRRRRAEAGPRLLPLAGTS
jgi:hypothetical protein